MPEITEETAVLRARAAAAQGDWQQAFDTLLEADARTPLPPAELGFLAEMAYASGRLDVTIDAWERAHADSLRVGDVPTAALAAVRVAMFLMVDTALMAPVRGWLKRADRLLEGLPDTPIHAWLAVVRNYERLLSGDFDAARRWAQRAIDVGAIHAPPAAAVGRVALARSIIFQGDVPQGLALLDEAAVAALSGEHDPITTGMVYCEVVCALQGVAQYDVAEEWTQAMERWRTRQPVGSIHGRCRVHRAEILRLRGACAEAEEEVLQACEELRPYLRRELGWPLSELGRIRFRKGDMQGAEDAFLEAHELGWDPQPGLALVHLAQGKTALALASIRESLDRPMAIPSKELPPNTDLRRAPLLEAQVEIEVATGDLDRAGAAAAELARIAASLGSNALAAAASLAEGRVRSARRDGAVARSAFELAVRQWSDIGAPYEAALARLGLADALQADGQKEAALIEVRAARAAFESMGATYQADRAARAWASVSEAADPTEKDALQGGIHVFRREGDTWRVAFGARSAHVRDSKGLRYLARLLAQPGREISALDLFALESGEAELPTGDSGPLLDTRAKEAYRRRLAEIEEDIDEARTAGDAWRAEQATAEKEFLARELARAVGLGGRDRRAGSASERARSAVTRALRQALERVRSHHEPLAEHLDRCIRTGTHCVYLPDPSAPVTWEI